MKVTTKLENLKSLVGKTIKSVDEKAENCKIVRFTDGTSVLLEAENIGFGLTGVVGYIISDKD